MHQVQRPDIASQMLQRPLKFLEEVSRDHTGLLLVGEHHGSRVYVINDPTITDEALRQRYTEFPRGKAARPFGLLLGNTIQLTDGEEWLEQKRVMQPPYRRENISKMVNSVVDVVDQVLARHQNTELDLNQLIFELTYSVIFQAIYGSDRPIDFEQMHRSLDLALEGIYQLKWEDGFDREQEVMGHIRYLRKLVSDAIEGDPNRHRDTSIISLLDQALRESLEGEALWERYINEMMVIFMGGYDVSHSVLFTLAMLAKNPELQAELRAEVRSLGDHLNYGHLVMNDHSDFLVQGKLHKVRLAYDETLRLFPPAWALTRLVTEPITLADQQIEANSILLFSPYLIQRNPLFWKDPGTFNPHREEYLKRLDPVSPTLPAYLPFGLSPRLCIGKHMVMLMSQVMVARVLDQFELHTPITTDIALGATTILLPDMSIPVQLRRTTAPVL